MRVFAIKDETMQEDHILGYLIYYEKAKAFYIELPDDADPWETPPILASFVRRSEHSVNRYWSRLWVEQRIIPPDRQNIGQILRDNHLEEYDEFSLLMLSMGRCAQDECYLEEISTENLPELLLTRWKTKVEDVVPMDTPKLLVFFRDGAVKTVDLEALSDSMGPCLPYLATQERFSKVEVQPGGHGVSWTEQASISDSVLYSNGAQVPLSLQDFCRFVQYRVINATEACNILGCSRQNIDDLIRRNKLHPIRTDTKYKLFLKNEVLQRKNS